MYEEEIYKLRERPGTPRSQAIWEIGEERARRDSCSSDYHNDDRRVARLDLGNKPLLPT